MRAELDRAHTGVSELDKILEGGFPRRSMILLSGEAGSGKTILATQFLYNGAVKYGEKGIYYGLLEDREDYIRNMSLLGMDIRALEGKDLFKFMGASVMDEAELRTNLEVLINTCDKFRPDRVVIDSISAIIHALDMPRTRAFLNTLSKCMKSIGATCILVGELPRGEPMTGLGVEEFIVDGVIVLRSRRSARAEARELEIVKMRGTSVKPCSFEYLIDHKSGGVEVIALKPKMVAAEGVFEERLTTGIEGLDEALGGGVYRGSVTLIQGHQGTGKTTMSLQFLAHRAKMGDKAIFLSFEEPVQQVKKTLQNYNIDYEGLAGMLIIESHAPEILTPTYYHKIILDLIEANNPSVIAIDSLTALWRVMGDEPLVDLLRYVQQLCKEKSLTAFLTSQILRGTADPTGQSGLSGVIDNSILLRRAEIGNKQVYTISILKTRGSKHSNEILPYEITDRGLVIRRTSAEER